MKKQDDALARKQKTFGNINVRKDVQYVSDGEREHRLDIIYPAENRNGITILYIHGGSYIYGYKEAGLIYSSYFVSKGFTVVSMNYRLTSTKTGITLKEQVQDVFSCLNFLKENRVYYNLDTDNMAIMGDSAGGHLSLLTNIIFHDEEARKYYGIDELPDVNIKCYALNSPMYDYVFLAHPTNTKILTKGLLKDIFSINYLDQEYLRMNSPRYYFNKGGLNLTPMLVTTSVQDMFNSQSQRLNKDNEKLGYDIAYFEEKNPDKKLAHVYNHFIFDREGEYCNNLMIDFINKHTRKDVEK